MGILMGQSVVNTWGDWRSLLAGEMYMPHGHCYLWQTPLVGLHLVANLLIAIAYFSIPIMLLYFVRKRQDMPFSRVFVLFGAFIVACGIGHTLDVVTLWFPVYWLSGIEHTMTALISCYTAVELYGLLPKFLSLKSPEALAQINQQLELQIQERQKAENILSQIIEGTAATTGGDFFPALVKHLAIALDVQQVKLTETLNHGEEKTLAHWHNPKFTERTGQTQHRQTKSLQFPICDRHQNTIGTLQVEHDESTLDSTEVTKLISIFTSRAAAEIERKHALETLAQVNTQLEEKVRERTAALEEINQALQITIQESQQATHALRSSEERFRSLVVNIPGAVYRCLPNENWTMEFLSNGIEAMIGYPATRFLGREAVPFGDIIHPDDHRDLRTSLAQLTPSQPTYNDEYRLIRSDGKVCWIYEQGTGIFGEDGQLRYLEGVMIDVTDRKLADQALEQERQQLRQVIRNAPLPMAMFDREMRYIAHSDQWLKDYGLEGQAIIGRSHYDVLPNVPDRWRQAHARALGGEIVSCEEDKFTRADGSIAYLKWKLQPWYRTDGELGGIIRISLDIHQLVEARETAIETSRLKSSFLANMSHEIRTPMNGILGIAELLQTTELTPQQQDFVRTLNASANHLLTLINDILDFSKIEAGEMSLEAIALNLVECVESVAELLSFQAHHKKVELLTYIAPELPQVLIGDPVRLRQILTNLVGNAIKFTAAGSVVIRASLLTQAGEDVTIRFEVKDTGIGIKQKDQQKLFRSFSQVDPSTTREYGGTGLGLAIAKQLVSMMGGDIGIESTWGEGSTFWFTVVLRRLEPTARFPQLPPRKVLAIESNKQASDILQSYLSACGMTVESHHSLLEGLVTLEQCSDYDVIFLSLPILAAPQEIKLVLGKLKSLFPFDRLVLLISSVDYPLLKPWLQEQGINHLMKPLQQHSLFHCLRDEALTHQDADGADLSLDPASPHDQATTSQVSILLVEDTPVNQMVIRNQLQVLGFTQLDCVQNGREALARLQERRYDLVLMDCLMPEMDGYETTVAIRQGEGADQHQLIVAMTANAMEGDREKCLEAGMDDYISKPTTIHAIQRVLNRILERLSSQGVVTGADHNEPAPIDLQRLICFYGDNEAFQREMLQEIARALPEYFGDLQHSVAMEDWDAMVYHAHRLKGTAATAGIAQVPNWLTAIERLIPLRDLDSIHNHMTQIETALQKTMRFIEQKLE